MVPQSDDENGSAPLKKTRHQSSQTFSQEFYRHKFGLANSCRHNACSTNRDFDPFCLCRLEDVALTEKKETPAINGSSKMREIPAGLMNLGNTCYMNSYLQTLFHLLPVRRIIYAWRVPAPMNRLPDTRYDTAEALQRLMARLQSTRYQFVSPDDLVDTTVDAARQHDVQEFMLLFSDLIDKAIAERKDEEKIQSLFTIRCKSIVKCRDCANESISNVTFADLGVPTQDIADIDGSLKAYFTEEKIDDYACDHCAKKTIAEKRLEMTDLPRFLNLHLHRFVYDRGAHTRKKLCHAVKFEACLDLRPYLRREQAEEWGEDGCCYELRSILIHRGDAHGGHYFARIRMASTGQWFTFDDDHVSSYEFTTENPVNTTGAYLLVYEKKRDAESSPPEPPIPEWIDVTRENEIRCGAQLKYLRNSLGEGGLHRCVHGLKVRQDSMITWVPTKWIVSLVRVLKSRYIDEPLEDLDMSPFLCEHKLLGNVRGLKAVDSICVMRLFNALDVSPTPCHLDSSHYCEMCTTISTKMTQLDSRNDEPD